MRSSGRQTGYMIEVPIIVVFVILILAAVLPNLSPGFAKALAVTGALIVTAGAYYMLIIPGWQAGRPSRLRPPWNWLIFVLIAAGILAAASAFTISA
jgi:hypothetical protein